MNGPCERQAVHLERTKQVSELGGVELVPGFTTIHQTRVRLCSPANTIESPVVPANA